VILASGLDLLGAERERGWLRIQRQYYDTPAKSLCAAGVGHSVADSTVLKTSPNPNDVHKTKINTKNATRAV
jgi:hypothetical protein